MKLYPACGAPGSEDRILPINERRLLSYHHISEKKFECGKILKKITKRNRKAK